MVLAAYFPLMPTKLINKMNGEDLMGNNLSTLRLAIGSVSGSMLDEQDGTILAWRFNTATNNFELAALLKGHTLTVVTLVVGGNRIYSDSMDNSIKVWILETLQCIQTLSDHTSVVMSLLCWHQFLLSCSLDNTIKGLLKLCGMNDSKATPVLLCSCSDNCVRAYELPSFSERGKIYTEQEVRTIQIGPGGLFFTRDGTGQVRVWNLLAQPAVAV